MVRAEHATAIACVHGGDAYPGLHGTVRFSPRKNGTLVIAEICGLPATDTGFFAFHIHENGNCSGSGFPNTGSHYDPDNRDHPLHMGDLPPLLSSGGTAYLAVVTDRFHIKDIIGRSVVIHSDPDDFRTQPAGNAGNKIACGVIRKV